MKITKETDYAFRIVLFLSKHQDDKKRFSGDELVEINEIPKNLGKRILTRLVEGKIINSKKGIGGGFCLERDRKDITLFDVMNIIEIMDFKDCVASNEICGFKSGSCAIHVTMERIREVLFSEFKAVTFEDLAVLENNGCKKICKK
ncbi:MAG: RrF2 family transcriptional regulator [Fusobacterium sp.]